jgi:hypothetical protein
MNNLLIYGMHRMENCCAFLSTAGFGCGFKQAILVLVLFLLFTTTKSSKAQEAGAIIYGGNFGLQFGNTTIVDISPNVGYQFNKFLMLGTGVSYQYYHSSYQGYSESMNIFGWRLFAEPSFMQSIVGHFEYEMLNMKVPDYDGGYKREWVNSLLVGGGYRVMISETAYSSLTLLWNVLDNPNSPYQNPIVRVGFGFGF